MPANDRLEVPLVGSVGAAFRLIPYEVRGLAELVHTVLRGLATCIQQQLFGELVASLRRAVDANPPRQRDERPRSPQTRAILERHEEITEIRMVLPNLHHWLVDLGPFGLDNPGLVFTRTREPHGLIEATVRRG